MTVTANEVISERQTADCRNDVCTVQDYEAEGRERPDVRTD